ncbi:MAG: efflux RND transporter periplasmic adaptor subunit [Oleibacter sp.]|nr:efflux RND transporter periplasmic adaptor subunit [Thalassolituus sp.]
MRRFVVHISPFTSSLTFPLLQTLSRLRQYLLPRHFLPKTYSIKTGMAQIGLATGLMLMMSVLQAQEDAMPVSVVTPQQAVPIDRLRLSGNLVAVQRASLSAQVDGLVETMSVDVGALVKTGDQLLSLDSALGKHLLNQLRASMAAAKATRDENRRLVKEAERLIQDNHLAQNELALRQAALAESEALLQVAQAELAGQQQQLNWHQLTAPFDGVVSGKLTEVGEWVSRGTPVFELVATGQVYLDVNAPQERFAEINLQTQVQVQPDALPGQILKGRIEALVPVSDSGSRTFRVRIVVTDPQQRLFPGTSASATFDLSRGENTALLVPRDALLRSPDGRFALFTVTDGKAQRRSVEIGQQSSSGVEILTGLQPNEPVVVRGNEVLRDQQMVRIVES